jgi:NADP-dependent 3-hydroxy acid dehydrogenase YdfG
MTTTRTATIAVTGAAAGVGSATAARLVADGHRVIRLDRCDAEVTGDLGTDEGRRHVLDQVMSGHRRYP